MNSALVKLHSFFQYPARFPLHVVHTIMEMYSGEYLDPFAGSGTVPVHAYLKGYPSKGYDLLPMLNLLVQAKLDILERRIDVKAIREELGNVKDEECYFDWLEKWWPKESEGLVCWLIRLVRENAKVNGCEVRSDNPTLVLLALHLARRVSLSDDVVYKWFRSKVKKSKMEKIILSGTLKNYYTKILDSKLKILEKLLRELPKPKGSDVEVKGCQDVLQLKDSADVILTSPPYLRAHEYVRSFKYELAILGLDRAQIRGLHKLEIPYRDLSDKCDHEGEMYLKYMRIVDPRSVKVYKNYFCALFQVFMNLDAKIIALFTGPAYLGGVHVPIHEIVKEYLGQLGYRKVLIKFDEIKRRRLFKRRNNKNKDGIKREVLLIMERK